MQMIAMPERRLATTLKRALYGYLWITRRV
jgi:hypothetical protein